MNLTMGEALFSLGSLQVTTYGAAVAAAALLAALLTLGLREPGLKADRRLTGLIGSLIGALVGARLIYCLVSLEMILADYDGWAFIPQCWRGGYTLFGGVWGMLLGARAAAKLAHADAKRMTDLLAPGAALLLAVLRAAEVWTNQGLGHYVMNEAMQHFPFAVANEYGDFQLPVFAYEALAALVMLAVLLTVRRLLQPGGATELLLVLLCSSQILLESLREDDFLRFGFVRFSQLAAAVTLAVVLTLRIRRGGKAPFRGWKLARVLLFALGIALVIGLEFALDKTPIDNRILYAVMAVCVTGIGIACWHNAPVKAAERPNG